LIKIVTRVQYYTRAVKSTVVMQSLKCVYNCIQWRKQKIFMKGGFIEWHMVVICIWCLLFVTSQVTSYSCFQTNVLAKFVDIIIICIFFYIHTSFLCVI